MAVFATKFSLVTGEPTEWIDITARVNDAVRASGILAGVACLNTMHTTAAVLVNEFQGAFTGDLAALADRLVPRHAAYRHNDARYSDCERGNARAHLRAALLGRGITVPIAEGQVTLGRDESIIFAEFDGPRNREVTVQIVGE
jgi:secondary thiamine-phosphate synthase enzyme